MPIRDTISLLENRLAARALHHVCEEQRVVSLAAVHDCGIDDASILKRLRAVGQRPRREMLRALREVREHIGVEGNDPRFFERVDDYLRGGLNPLNQMVRSLIEEAVHAGGDAAAPEL